mmetsp:Transcript_20304/g.38457  ORF Transcript_20304/g.38457 Transcript_20304/m.38457 type:complete len:128 (+) Transcript_20304:167-550(+)
MFRGLRKKPTSPKAKTSHDGNGKMPFINSDGRENGIKAGRDYQASLEFLKASPPSPVKRIADKLEAIPPALELISHAKDSRQKGLATQDLAFKADAVQSAVHSFLDSRRAAIEEEEARRSKEQSQSR